MTDARSYKPGHNPTEQERASTIAWTVRAILLGLVGAGILLSTVNRELGIVVFATVSLLAFVFRIAGLALFAERRMRR